MAAADYRLCDKCEAKTFYDSDVSYDFDAIFKVRGRHYGLGNLGDWVCLCKKCAEDFEVDIRPREKLEQEARKGE